MTDPVLDLPAPKTPPSPKVIFAAAAAFVAPAVLLVINYLLTPEGQKEFLGLPLVVQILIGGLLTSGATYVTGYVKRDPIRETGARRAKLS